MSRQRRGPAVAGALAAAAVLVPAATISILGWDSGRAAYDAAIYHERVIRTFAEQLPWIELRNPLTTTTPGYHATMAVIGRLISDDLAFLRIVGACFGAAFVSMVAAWCARIRGPLEGLLLAMPLACSIYVVGSAAWLLPDDAGWMLVAATLFTCLGEHRTGTQTLLAGGLLLALVLVRQTHLWAAGPVAVACLLPAGDGPPAPLRTRAARAGLSTLPAVAAVGAFAVLWGGLVPPRFRSDVSGVNPATPAFVLFQFCLFGAAFLPWLWPAAMRAVRERRAALLAAAALGLVAALLPATVPDRDAGRFSGWWAALENVPSIGGHANLAIVALAPIGAAIVAAALLRLPGRAGAVLGTAIVAFVAAVSTTHYSWQRYHEPFVLLALAILSAMQPTEGPGSRSAAALKATTVGGLCAVLAAISWRGMAGPPVDHDEPVPPQHVMPDESPQNAGRATQPKIDPIASPTAGK